MIYASWPQGERRKVQATAYRRLSMKSLRIHSYESPPVLTVDEAPAPRPAAGEVLVRVHAAAVTPSELSWLGTRVNADGTTRALPIVPGHEFSGIVEALGSDVSGFSHGDRVFGLVAFARDGAQTEYVVALPHELAAAPRSLDDAAAATVPIGALTAWQALFDHGRLTERQTVLVHGGAGSVGAFAVQLARSAGATVVATASARDASYVLGLGAHRVVDYRSTRFEDVVSNADLVLDTVGGDTLERSWAVLRSGGALVSIAGEPRAPSDGKRGAFFIVEPNKAQLSAIAEMIDGGVLKTAVAGTVPLEHAAAAYDGSVHRARPGKVVSVLG
jgi:NADPH:quinone reductase-like Zn-dependent oxidoreductase